MRLRFPVLGIIPSAEGGDADASVTETDGITAKAGALRTAGEGFRTGFRRRNIMDFLWLENYVKLSESMSIRTAAAELGVSPSTLSSRISMLEESLGAKLINRTSQGCEMTDAGRIYLAEAEKLLKEWDSVMTTVKLHDSNPGITLRLLFEDRLVIPIVGRFLDGFIERHPSILISIYDDSELSARESLVNNQADLLFSFMPRRSMYNDMVHRPVYHTNIDALIPESHPLAINESISLSDLDNNTFLIYPGVQNNSLHQLELDILQKSGISYSIYDGHVSPSFYTIITQVYGLIALYPRILKIHLPPRLNLVSLNDPYCKCDIHMIYNPNNANPALKIFIEEFGDTEAGDE